MPDDERRRAAGGGQAALRAEQFGVRRLESRHLFAPRAAIPLAAPQDLQHGGLPRLAPLGPPGPAALVHRHPTEQRGLVGRDLPHGPLRKQARRGQRACGKTEELTTAVCHAHAAPSGMARIVMRTGVARSLCATRKCTLQGIGMLPVGDRLGAHRVHVFPGVRIRRVRRRNWNSAGRPHGRTGSSPISRSFPRSSTPAAPAPASRRRTSRRAGWC